MITKLAQAFDPKILAASIRSAVGKGMATAKMGGKVSTTGMSATRAANRIHTLPMAPNVVQRPGANLVNLRGPK